jgi:uncharacterized membrane protein
VHLVAPDGFLPIVPDWVPRPRETVLVTGLCEIAGSIALLTRRLRRFAGVMLALYAVCVFPTNIKHAVDGIHVPPVPDGWWYHGPRLALQPVGRFSVPASSIGRSPQNRTNLAACRQITGCALLPISFLATSPS